MSLSLTILFRRIWEEQQASACRMSVIDGHKDNDDEGDFSVSDDIYHHREVTIFS